MINYLLHKKKIWAAALSSCFFMLACENNVTEVRALGEKPPGIEEGRNIESFLSMNGKVTAKLTAPLLLRYQGDSAKRAEFPNTIRVDFFNDSLQQESQLNAQYARYNENESKVFLRDNVIAFNYKGDTLFCKELYWDQTQGKLYTDKPAILSQQYPIKQRIYAAHGLESNQNLTKIVFFNMSPGSFAIIPDSTVQ